MRSSVLPESHIPTFPDAVALAAFLWTSVVLGKARVSAPDLKEFMVTQVGVKPYVADQILGKLGANELLTQVRFRGTSFEFTHTECLGVKGVSWTQVRDFARRLRTEGRIAAASWEDDTAAGMGVAHLNLCDAVSPDLRTCMFTANAETWARPPRYIVKSFKQLTRP